MTESKFKSVIGDTLKESWVHFDMCTANTEGRLIAVNPKFLAASWNTQNGGVAILDPFKPCSVKPDIPLIKGFKGPVLDLEFSPFRTDLLATASEDCSVKLFQIPEEGLTKTTHQELQSLPGHVKKVTFVDFNPSVADCLLSASFDDTVKVWNVVKGEELCSLSVEANPTSVWWNGNGSLLASCAKNKLLKVFDPRQKKAVVSVLCHESVKSSKLAWMDSDNLLTCGFTKANAKEVKHWDIRKVGDDLSCAPVSTTVVDHSSAVATPYFDKESRLLYTLGKGETTIHIFDFNTDKVLKCIDFQSQEPATVYGVFDRRSMNYNKCEVDRFVKFSKDALYVVSFKIPRKVDMYDPALYPPVPAGEPAVAFDAWVGGETKDPVKKKIDEVSTAFVSGDNTFSKSEGKPAGGDDAKVKELEAKVAELEAKVKALTDENEELKKQLAA